MAKKSGLGRGLDVIFSDNELDRAQKDDIQKIRLSMIEHLD